MPARGAETAGGQARADQQQEARQAPKRPFRQGGNLSRKVHSLNVVVISADIAAGPVGERGGQGAGTSRDGASSMDEPVRDAGDRDASRRSTTQASSPSPSDLASEVARLRRENGQLRMERDILKKAALIFGAASR